MRRRGADRQLQSPRRRWFFTYFTTCIEGGVGRVNDSIALHDGDVGLDNLQLQTTTTNNRQQHGGETQRMNRSNTWDYVGGREGGEKVTEDKDEAMEGGDLGIRKQDWSNLIIFFVSTEIDTQ